MIPPCSKRALPRRGFLVALSLAAIAAACSSGPYTAALHFEGSPQLNPTFDGEPSALTLRIFALKDAEAFRNASVEQLLAAQPDLAPNTWLPPHKEATVYAGQATDIPFEIKPEVRFVGIFGMFNEMTEKARLVLSVDEVDDEPKLQLDKFAITVLGVTPAAPATDTAPQTDGESQGNGDTAAKPEGGQQR